MPLEIRVLHEFITLNHDGIVERTRERVRKRPWPPPSTAELEHGVPLFLTQLSDTLQWEMTATPFASDAIGNSATLHGGDLQRLGFTVSQVVHDYGDICQAITEIAIEHEAPVTVEEFNVLNRCLDAAIAEAVTEHARLTAALRSTSEIERLGQVAHEVRDSLNTALLAFHTLQRGAVAVNGSTASVLGRSLMRLRDFLNSTLSEIRLTAQVQDRKRLTLAAFLDDIAITGGLHAEYRNIEFAVELLDPELEIDTDPQLLASALTNLVNNAFKFTPPGGRVVLRAHAADGRLVIEVEDQCGGIPTAAKDPFAAFGSRRGKDRTGLGLGLSIARKAVRAQGGDITIRNLPGTGCIFVIDLPMHLDASAAPPLEV